MEQEKKEGEKRFCVFSGFLGTGKTSLMMALMEEADREGRQAAMIANDLGDTSLIDCQYAKAKGLPASEMTKECICYQTENLADRLRMLLYTQDRELVISDIPGFGVGALNHVYQALGTQHSREFVLAPFTVVTDHTILEKMRQDLRDGAEDPLAYIRDAQLKEAELVLLNKCDLVGPKTAEADAEFIRTHYPDTQVLKVSARTGAGIPEALAYLLEKKSSLKNPDLQYGGERFQKAMTRMCEYNTQFLGKICCEDFDPDEWLKELAVAAGREAAAAGIRIHHMKLYSLTEKGRIGRVDLTDSDTVTVQSKIGGRCTSLPVTINLTAEVPEGELETVMEKALNEAARKYNISLYYFYMECFGPGHPKKTDGTV